MERCAGRLFKIVNKIKNCPYYTGHIAGGASNNLLGSRWLGLNANGTTGDTYAIHGNNSEDSISKYISHSCVRMHNADVEELFDKVAVGTSVTITYSSKTFESWQKYTATDSHEKIKAYPRNLDKLLFFSIPIHELRTV